MVELIFTFEVPKERQEEFLNHVKTGTKPYWESHGCLGYNVWQAVGEDSFMKRMEFPDMATLEKVVPAVEQDPVGKALIEKWDSFCENILRKPYIKLT
jgi:quinol monooxygenase YgiN